MNAAAAFERVLTGALVRKTNLQRAEKEAAKTAFFARGAAQRFVLEQVLEERLREILSVVNGMAAAAQIGVDWPPIDAAKFRHSRLSARIGFGAGGENDAPRRLGKTCVAGARRSVL